MEKKQGRDIKKPKGVTTDSESRNKMFNLFENRSEAFFGVPDLIIQDIDRLVDEIQRELKEEIEQQVISRFLAYGYFTIPPKIIPGAQGHEIIGDICTACGECCRGYDVSKEQEEILYTSPEYNPPCRFLTYHEDSDQFLCGIFHLGRVSLCNRFQCLPLKILAIISGHNLIHTNRFSFESQKDEKRKS